jgi:hypothetical protein
MRFDLRPYQQEALDAIVAAELRGIRRPLYWMHDGEHFVLSLGTDGWMVLSPTPDALDASERWTVRHIQPQGGRTVVARDLSLAYAQGLAEDRARSTGAGGLVNPPRALASRAGHQPPAADGPVGPVGGVYPAGHDGGGRPPT